MSTVVRAAFSSVLVCLAVTLVAGVDVSEPAAGLTASGDPVMIAVGDIACDPASTSFRDGLGTKTACQQLATSRLAAGQAPDVVAVLGDNVYECGSLAAYQQSYHPTWGVLKGATEPVPGNHEYLTSHAAPETGCDSSNAGAAGYFAYFGAAAGDRGHGWYSYDVGAWHVIALNSDCSFVGGCTATSPQGKWLAADLAAHPTTCTLAYWHHPLVTSGTGDTLAVRPLQQQLYDAHADLILNGHRHWYERLAPLNAAGSFDPVRGMREIIAGTGGEDHAGRPAESTIDPSSEVLNTTTFGVLKLTLQPSSYSWKFLPVEGSTFTDSGTTSCHQPSTDTTSPSIPTGLTAQAATSTSMSLAWSPSTDDTEVVGYRVYRDGSLVGSSTTPSYTDAGLAAGSTHSYTVDAFDAGENVSKVSDAVTGTTSGIPTPTTMSFTATADGYVNANKPAANFGATASLLADGSPRLRTFMRFAVSGVGARVVDSAQLVLYTTNSSPSGGMFSGTTGGDWTESALTWDNQPAPGPTVATLGQATSGATQRVDVTSLVKGDGVVDVAVTSSDADNVGYASRQAVKVARRPTLVLTVH